MKNRILDGRVCESFFAEDLNEALNSLDQLHDLGELRFDLSQLHIDDLKHIRKESHKKLIFTCRGTNYSQTDLLKIYEEAIQCRFDFIDIDFEHDGQILSDLEMQLAQSSHTKLILSYHNYDTTPELKELIPIASLLFSTQADLIKVACMANQHEDIDTLLQLQNQFENTICLAMGKWATESRIKSLKANGLFTFTALKPESSTAPGQMDLETFHLEYLKFRGEEELKLAVLGHPITHSKSPDLFQEFFQSDKIKGAYEKIELNSIDEFLLIRDYFDGFNVTAPFKQSIIPNLNELSQAAQQIGAVNTVYKVNESWIGDNTDYLGILNAIKTIKTPTEIENCLIIGAGGAARAAAFAMNYSKIKTTITNRTSSKANDLALEFKVSAIEQAKLNEYSLIINTIPEPFSVINPEELNSKHIVLDAIYPNSAFTRYAAERGLILIQGEVWLERQALEAYRIFKKTKDLY